ncbi:MAG TPA: hypothetical protein VNI01_10970, partial [Elusimicrobiota bacterium]|nr:hypothetical protein [Elusimicrobiota bacterium]
MARRLASVLLALALLAPDAARACRYCGLAPAPEAPAEERPGEPHDLRRDPQLTETEAAEIQAEGRYRVQDEHVLDTQAPTDAHL